MPFFFKSKTAGGDEYFPDPRAEKTKELGSRKDSLLTAIKDIEFDYGLGKLSREDYEELHGKYRMEAAGLLKEIDSLGAGASADGGSEDIEREIRARKGQVRVGLRRRRVREGDIAREGGFLERRPRAVLHEVRKRLRSGRPLLL